MTNPRVSQSSLRKLPSEIRKTLNEKIDSDTYGKIDDVVAWLSTSGHERSRSAVGRYIRNRQKSVPVVIRRPEASAADLIAQAMLLLEAARGKSVVG